MTILHRSTRSAFAVLACLPLTAASAQPPREPSRVVTPDARVDVTPLLRSVPRIGMNLDAAAWSYYGASYPAIDRARTMSKWGGKYKNYDNMPEGAVIMNPQTGLPGAQSDNVMKVNAMFGVDPASLPTPDRYIVTWRGAGRISIGFGAARNIKEGDHSFAFDYTGNDRSASLEVGELNARDPFRDLHIVRADQVAAFEAGQVFAPEFLAKVSQWSVLRFMDWGHTNGSAVTSWDQLPTQTSGWGETGAPLGTMVDLANAAGTDMWYCIPAHANDDFVRRALTYIRDHLDPKRKLHLEYSNEVWNGGFEQFRYAQEQGKALGERLKTPKPLGGMEWYGYRSAQIAKITDEVFGDNARARVRNVVGTQTYWPGLEEAIWQGVQLSGLGSPAKLFEEYAITTYFGHSLGSGPDAEKAKMLGWARGGQAGLDAAFQELTVGGQLSDNSSLVALRKALDYHARVARKQGLDLVAYEGGQHLTAIGYADKEQDDITAFIARILNDPRMGQLYAQMVDEFGAVGGKTLVAFNDVGAPSKWGGWGVLDTIYQQHSPRYDALVAAQKRARAAP